MHTIFSITDRFDHKHTQREEHTSQENIFPDKKSKLNQEKSELSFWFFTLSTAVVADYVHDYKVFVECVQDMGGSDSDVCMCSQLSTYQGCD